MSPAQQFGGPISLRRIFALGVAVVLTIAIVIASYWSFEHIDADEILVVQSPIQGELTWYVTAGIKPQVFGKTTIYKKRSIYRFDDEKWETVKSEEKSPDGKVVQVDRRRLVCCGLEVRFNDGGHGTMLGSIQYDMPLDPKNLTAIHTRYGSQEAVQKQVIETSANKAIYHAGPTMSSKESYAERRNDLIFFVEDQIQLGVYKTRQREVRVKDPLSGQEKSVTTADIMVGKDGKPERQEVSPLQEFGIRAFHFTIKKLPYDDVVERQIQQQQAIAMDVQTAIADAKKAEQRTITVTENGKANAAEAKWLQEKINAKDIAEAEKNKKVAELDAQAAEQKKREQILLGEGEAARKRLVMQADGALQPKLAALVDINKAYAEAIKGYGGNWVPSVVMGGGPTSSMPGSGAQTMIDLLTAHTAKQLGVDLGVLGRDRTVTEKASAAEPAAVKEGQAAQVSSPEDARRRAPQRGK